MMSSPEILARFINDLVGQGPPPTLVINGDFVDFLALEPAASWTESREEAVSKLVGAATTAPDAVVFDAMRESIAAGLNVVIVVGNHDLELALPEVQEAFRRRVAANPTQLRFLDDGSALRFGQVLIEHGNRYDPPNHNDWHGVRLTRSARSRDEDPPRVVEPSAGSEMVIHVINELSGRYPFVNLLQPEGYLTGLFLLCCEPSLIMDSGKLSATFSAARKRWMSETGARPSRDRNIGHASRHGLADEELSGEVNALFAADRSIAASEGWRRYFARESDESLSAIVREDRPIPVKRLRVLRRLLARMEQNAWVFEPGTASGATDEAAQRLLQKERIQLVVMGHTHVCRDVRSEFGRYLNTGTWADTVRVTAQDIASDEAADMYIRQLVRDDGVRCRDYTFADIRLDADGALVSSTLERVPDA